MKELLQFPAELVSHKTYATKHNGSIMFELQENIEPEGLSKLLSAKGKTGYLVFNPTMDEKLEVEDIPDEQIHETETKTKSQRLRSTLFVYWKQNKVTTPFPAYYDTYMEKKIDEIKDKLLPE